jgi:glycosyltransferase involved in cell wall biosynthesis
MRIAQVAPPLEAVPPARYGGTERVIHTLTEELVRRGHEVTLFASGDSRTSARLVPTCEQAVWHREPPPRDVTPVWSTVIGKLLRQFDEFDVVHSHIDHVGFPLARQARVPLITTMHGRLDLREIHEVLSEFAEVPLVSISDAQRLPVKWANFVATVHHGIELDEFHFNARGGEYLAFLGRVSPEKGLDTAIRVARKAGMPLKVAARMPLPTPHDLNARADAVYWTDVIQPLLGPDIELVGEIGGQQKDAFLGKAAALLFPVRWPEPFGLVMAEALACGTPVLALRNGSVPEVVRDGATGFVVESEEDLASSVDRLWTIDRQTCRADAERRFSPRAMAAAYERVYACLLNRTVARIVDMNPVRRGAQDAAYPRSRSQPATSVAEASVAKLTIRPTRRDKSSTPVPFTSATGKDEPQ